MAAKRKKDSDGSGAAALGNHLAKVGRGPAPLVLGVQHEHPLTGQFVVRREGAHWYLYRIVSVYGSEQEAEREQRRLVTKPAEENLSAEEQLRRRLSFGIKGE